MAGKTSTGKRRSPPSKRKPASAGSGDVRPDKKKTADSDTCDPQDAGQRNTDVRVVCAVASAGATPMDIKQLEDELNTTKEYLQATIEALETPHKEYKTANQKLRSVNEALQSAKEALDTSREDLQSTNGVTIAFIDITEWRQVHKLQRITAVFEKSSDAVTVQDVDGNIIAWNRAAERLYGWTEKEATRMHITEITAEKNRHEYAAVARKLLRGETVTPFEYVRIPKAVDPITV